MTETTELDEAAIRARLEAATPGPWEWEPDSCSDDGLTYTPSRVWTHGGVDYFGEANDDYVLASHLGNADAEFIAHARTDVGLLLTALDEARAEVERLHFDLDREAHARQAAEGAVAAVREALAELVALKDGPRDSDYERRKPLAWERARALVTDTENETSAALAARYMRGQGWSAALATTATPDATTTQGEAMTTFIDRRTNNHDCTTDTHCCHDCKTHDGCSCKQDKSD